MKKFIVSILAIVYISTSAGATVYLHYCMGKLESWGLSAKNDAKCSSCGMHKTGHKGCCHDEQKQVKIEKDQKVNEPAFQFLVIPAHAIITSVPNWSVIYLSTPVIKSQNANAPPRSGSLSAYILNRNFRI